MIEAGGSATGGAPALGAGPGDPSGRCGRRRARLDVAGVGDGPTLADGRAVVERRPRGVARGRVGRRVRAASSGARGAGTSGPSATVATAPTSAIGTIRRARRIPARRGRDAAIAARTIPRTPVARTIPRCPTARSAPERRRAAARGRAAGRRPGRRGADPSRPAARACSSSSWPRRWPRAPIELTRVGKWIERVPTLPLDGERPTSRALAARLASFWLPVADGPVHRRVRRRRSAARVAAMERTALGDRRPHAGGHWLTTLRDVVAALRVWWAATDATEEYEDALLAAFAEGVPADRPWRRCPTDRSSCRSPTCAGRPASAGRPGLTGSLLPRSRSRAAATDPRRASCPTAMPRAPAANRRERRRTVAGGRRTAPAPSRVRADGTAASAAALDPHRRGRRPAPGRAATS